jgi:hypothetical protein
MNLTSTVCLAGSLCRFPLGAWAQRSLRIGNDLRGGRFLLRQAIRIISESSVGFSLRGLDSSEVRKRAQAEAFASLIRRSRL